MGTLVRFGQFEADLEAGELRKRGAKIRLRNKSFEVLAALLKRPGEVVKREELSAALWSGKVFVDFDNNLNAAVATLREALGESSEKPKFIETVPRRGYRFIGRISESDEDGRKQRAHKVMMAILPLKNLSGNPAEDYFSDGMTEELITRFATLMPKGVGVIARATAMKYKSGSRGLARIRKELDVDYVLEGSVRREDDRVRISTQLIQVSDQTNVWAASYDGELRDILRLQGEVAEAVARQIKGEMLPLTSRRSRHGRAVDPQVHDAYLRGLFEFNKSNPPGLGSALDFFRIAIEKDTQYAPAHAKAAITHAFSALWGFDAPSHAFPKAEAAAKRALELDDSIGDAHNALGIVRWFYHWDCHGCRREFERSVEINPSDPFAHWGLAMYFGAMVEDHKRAEAEACLAQELDPLSTAIRSNAAFVYYWSRDYPRAISHSKETLERDENCLVAYYLLGMAACANRSFDLAIATLEAAAKRFADPVSLGYLGRTYGVAGEGERARAVLRQLEERAASQYVPAICFAWINLGLGLKDAGLSWLEKAHAEHDAKILWVRVSEFYDPIRSEPRFQQLVNRLGLPQRTAK